MSSLPLHATQLLASRRLLGANVFSRRAGAVLEVSLEGVDDLAQCVERWRTNVRTFIARLQWGDQEVVVHQQPKGAHLFLTAPIDALLTATDVAEQAWLAAIVPSDFDAEDTIARLRVAALHEKSDRLVALAQEAESRSLQCIADDDEVSLGSGSGSLTVQRRTLPLPNEVEWSALHEIPIALVTGSNGKTTTTRLASAMLAAAGHTVAHSSTDGVWLGTEALAEGDYSGPGGARLALRDTRATCAVLETARGGILRRGLAVQRADVAVVTRIAADHFGEYGIHDLDALARVKLVVASVVPPAGRIVLNADDPTLVRLAPTLRAPVTWFSLNRPSAPTAAPAYHTYLDGDEVVLQRGDRCDSLGTVRDITITLAGQARHNIANALAAIACASALGVSIDVMRDTLATFGRDPADNPGRLVLLERDGVRIVVDYVHNPDGWDAIYEATRALPATRRLVVVGQAGDRDDGALHALAESVVRGSPDLVVVKELPRMLRGRAAGETSSILARSFSSLGMDNERLIMTSDERSAVTAALGAARTGDVVILAIHEDYAGTMRFLATLGAAPSAR